MMNEALVEARPDDSSDSNVIEFPIRDGYEGQDSVQDVVFEVATAEDLESAVVRLAEWLRHHSGVSRVELWSIGDDGEAELLAEAGSPRGTRHNMPLGPAAVLVLHGSDPTIDFALSAVTPIFRRLVADERLTKTAMQLARRNEALEDFAALVAHELKTPLHAALVADDPSGLVEEALALVDTVLQAARNEPSEKTPTSVAGVLDQAVEDLRTELAIDADLTATLPLPPEPLRVILRNLLSNAVAAGAGHVHVTAERSSGSLRLLVDDDGVGLAVDQYASGSGLGLALSRRIAIRFGGRLELAPNPSGGTRAELAFVEAAQ
jgi:signal transduction histidine kinase